MSDKGKRVFPVERAGSLDSRIRRWLQNPRKILGPYIEEGMVVLDLGCGPCGEHVETTIAQKSPSIWLS